jgi:hypothetical protein
MEEYMKKNPGSFCIPSIIKRELQNILIKKGVKKVVSSITGLKKNIFESNLSMFKENNSICDTTDKRFYHTGDTFWISKHDQNGIFMHINYPFLNAQMYECFCMDYGITDVSLPKQQMYNIIFIYNEIQNMYYSFGNYEFTMDYLCYKFSFKMEELKESIEFLIKNQVLSRYPFEDGTFATNELQMDETLIHKKVLDGEEIVFSFLRDTCSQIYFLATPYYSSEYFQTIQKICVNHSVELVITNSFFSKKYIQEEIGLTSYLYKELNVLKNNKTLKKINCILLEGIQKMDLFHLSFIFTTIKHLCDPQNFKIIFVGDDKEHSCFTRSFTCNHIIQSLAENFGLHRMTGEERIQNDIVRQSMKEPNKIIEGIDNFVQTIVTGFDTEYVHNVKAIAEVCKLEKKEKKQKMVLQLFCSGEQDKSFLLRDVCSPDKQNGGLQTFSIGDKIQCVEEGWAGEIKRAYRYLESGSWKEVQSKEFMYLQRNPHKLEVVNKKTKY